MTDMLVRLYDLPDPGPLQDSLAAAGVNIGRARPEDLGTLRSWLAQEYPGWVAEAEAAFRVRPPTCLVAWRDSDLVGFACYDVTAPNFFGPTAVRQDSQHLGIGTVLLLDALGALRDQGYAYAIIGGVGPAEFYEKAVDAIAIPGSTPGIYRLPD